MDVFLHTVGSTLPVSPAKKASTHDATEKGNPGGVVASEDTVEASLQLRTLTENVMSAPIVNAERVSTLTNAIASGHYQIDPQMTANRLMELEMLAP